MWCASKGVNCYYCGVFGECRRGSCGFAVIGKAALGTPSSYLVNTASEKSIDDIKREAVKEFAEKLKEKAWQGYQVGMYIVDIQQIDELLKEYEK